MHYWGDSWFQKNGDRFQSTIYWIMVSWQRYGRIGSRGKEKWGMFDDYPVFWDGGLHGLIWPSYAYVQNKFIYQILDRYVICPITKYTGIHWLGIRYQYIVYNAVIQYACKQNPDMINELVCGLERYELVNPGIFGSVCGTTVHDNYWK